jgi:hypothetical protein
MWQLEFNVSKCKVLHLGISNERMKYEMSETILEITTREKDLEVFTDEEIKFHGNVVKTINKTWYSRPQQNK